MKRRSFLSLFCGLGGGSLGFVRAGWDCVGAVDADPEACADHQYLTSHPATVADLSTMQPHELRAACTGPPDVVFTSPPCKGFSACQPIERSRTAKYRAMNSLAERGVMLALEAWPEAPPKLILLENVPRAQTRGREWLDAVQDMLRAYGYACSEQVHDCGEWGGLAQRRKRVLLVARHLEQVPAVLCEPPSQRVRSIGEVLWDLPVPVPGSTEGGPMHALPRLAAINWVRLALIRAGRDWRDLPASVRVSCSPRSTVYGVADADAESGTVVGAARHDNGAFSVADPRPEGLAIATHQVDGEAFVGPELAVGDRRPIHLVIEAADHTWHRPMTTLELAVLQGFPAEVDGAPLRLTGQSHGRWRQRIGNAVPPPTAEAIARAMSSVLDDAEHGDRFRLVGAPIWVQEPRNSAAQPNLA